VNSGHVLKRELTEFADGLTMTYEKRRDIKDNSKISVLSLSQVSASLCLRPFSEVRKEKL
jgi:hypothetical protein